MGIINKFPFKRNGHEEMCFNENEKYKVISYWLFEKFSYSDMKDKFILLASINTFEYNSLLHLAQSYILSFKMP